MSGPNPRLAESGPAQAPTEAEFRGADAGYRPFPSFSEWLAAVVDASRWERYSATLSRQRRATAQDVWRNAVALAMRAAAIDTGALEGLYDVDRGFTLSVAGRAGDWEAALQRKGSKAVRFIEAQIKAYDYVTELAAQETPLTEASIRALHAELCASQETYTVLTPVGWQEQPLPRGEYKRHPNHVMTPGGTLHAYAPVQSTAMEMERLCTELRADLFQRSLIPSCRRHMRTTLSSLCTLSRKEPRNRASDAPEGYRIPPGDPANVINLLFRTSTPVPDGIRRKFQIRVPIDPSGEDDLMIAEIDGDAVLTARIAELLPRPGAALEARARMRAAGIVAETLQQLTTRIATHLGRP